MRMVKALRESLAEQGAPIVTDYTLFLLIWKLYRAGEFHGEKISLKVERPAENQLSYFTRKLYAERYLRVDDDFTGTAYRVSDVPDGQAEDLTAIVDPFCYLSHLSAMQRYGLTNRAPEALTLSTPFDWKTARDQKMIQDFGEPPEVGEYRYVLSKIHLPARVRKRRVEVHITKRTPLIKPIRGSAARIAAVGETFVQTLDRPELCGGMMHVLDVWDEHAPTYIDEIIEAISRAPEKLIKVRAGHILEERLGIQDSRIENWLQFAQRGGSQRLDPSQPYVSKYSEKWMISLNVPHADSSS